MKKALVSGHAGFVGRHLVPALERDGWDVTGIDLRGIRREGTEGGLTGEGIDIRDYFRSQAMDVHYDLVVHLAAVVGGRQLIEGSPLSVAVDLSIDAELFGWAMRTRPGRVVYYSSSAAYPIRLQEADHHRRLAESDIDLDAVSSPDLTYGWAKLTGEILARHAREAGVAVTVLRPFSGAGPDQDLDYPVPAICERVKQRMDPLEIWSDAVRDIIHIDDVIATTMASIAGGIDGPLNVCTGQATSFSDLARMAASIAGYSPTIVVLSDKPAGVAYRVGDPSRMNQVYVPRIPLESLLKEMLT